MKRAWGGIELDITGSDEVKANLAILAQQPFLLAQDFKAELETELTEMVRRAPIGGPDDRHAGQLRESGHVDPPVADEEGLAVVVRFGNAEIPYAIAQHQKYYEHPHGGQREFMLSVLEESKPFLGARIVRRAQARLERSVR